jgi:hypothetical protein
VIGRPREHARELRFANAFRERARLAVEVGEERLVVLRRGELEELFRVSDVLGQRLGELDLLDQGRAAAQRGLGPGLVVPEPGFARELI